MGFSDGWVKYQRKEVLATALFTLQVNSLKGITCKTSVFNFRTCNLPSSVLWIVTHLEGWVPLVVMAVIKLSNSSRFSLSFLTKDSIARLEKLSLSPPWRWHINECTMDRHASAEVGLAA